MRETILIVEDYDDTRCLMKFMLETYGFRVLEAADGTEAIDRFRQQKPDLVLMDLSLPVVDGLTATKQIRQLSPTDKIPIIAVTAYGDIYRDKALEAGCDALIGKPLDFDKLEPVLNQYLNS
jgi:two-component system, cell cycle response regulator DivK